ncbi:MAG: TatD family hydrolase [Planctomycetota bacterium]|nr:TatD family hydrolase [Planctomycetaceae bacterium]MDQ3330538.1 TatD family hydrolase [Planctomycetota bacterium]
MRLFDTHCHLDEPAFDGDRDAVIERARAAGVVAMLTIGTTAASSEKSVELAKRHRDVFAAVGVQPNYVAEEKLGEWERIVALAGDERVVAIGETGLDRYWDYTPFEAQIEAFDRHLDLSRTSGKPFIVHCRDAEADIVAQLRNAAAAGPLRGVMHSFAGDPATAEACLELGLYISFAGMVTFKRNDALRAVAKAVPLDRLLIETDAPYLAPMPHRGKRNEPAFVAHTATVLANVHGLPTDELAERATINARTLFAIDSLSR